MNRTFVYLAMMCASGVPALGGILFEDLDPGPGSTTSSGLIITSVPFDASRPAVGDVDVGAGTGPFMGLTTPSTFDVSALVGKPFNASAEVYVPTSTTMDSVGDSIYLQLDFSNSATPKAGGNFVRYTAGFYGFNALLNNGNFDKWLLMNVDDFVPATTPAGGSAGAQPIDTADFFVVFTDGGFGGGMPNNAADGTFALVDNFRFSVVPEPASLAACAFACLLTGATGRRSRRSTGRVTRPTL